MALVLLCLAHALASAASFATRAPARTASVGVALGQGGAGVAAARPGLSGAAMSRGADIAGQTPALNLPASLAAESAQAADGGQEAITQEAAVAEESGRAQDPRLRIPSTDDTAETIGKAVAKSKKRVRAAEKDLGGEGALKPQPSLIPKVFDGITNKPTVLVVDLVGSEHLRQELSADALRGYFTIYHERIRDVALRHSALHAETDADDQTYLFPAMGHALAAAMEILRGPKGLYPGLPAPLQVRLGLDMGKVFEIPSHEGKTYIGEPVGSAGDYAHRGHGGDLVLPPELYPVARDALGDHDLDLLTYDRHAVRVVPLPRAAAPPAAEPGSGPLGWDFPEVTRAAVLEADVVGSRRLFALHGAAPARVLMEQFHDLFDEIVRANFGYLSKSPRGDNIRAFFYRVREAAQAGARMLLRLRELNIHIAEPFDIRLGLDRGRVLFVPAPDGPNIIGKPVSEAGVLAHRVAGRRTMAMPLSAYEKAKARLPRHIAQRLNDDRRAVVLTFIDP